MSLNGALQIGQSALFASSAALQVAGNNMANAATPGFHRRTISLAPLGAGGVGVAGLGQGVQILNVRREVDIALQSRYRDSLSQEMRAAMDFRYASAIETLQNELSENDVSSMLSQFFNSFSELANNPSDHAMRAVVVQEGVSLAARLSSLRSDYNTVLEEVNQSLGISVSAANDMLDQIAAINQQISTQEGAGSDATALRDQRDTIIDELSQLIDVSVIEKTNGSVDVLVGSIPVVIGTESRGLDLRQSTEGDTTHMSLRVGVDGTFLNVTGGAIGGLLTQRAETIEPAIEQLDRLAQELIRQVNILHSQGQGETGYTSITANAGVVDPTVPLNQEGNGLAFEIGSGSFFVHVTDQATGTTTAHEVAINGDAMSMQDLVDVINGSNGVPNVTASIGPGNKLILAADEGCEISFSDDSAGALLGLGVNTFFTGSNAADINVTSLLQEDPSHLAIGSGHILGSGQTALAIAGLQDQEVDGLSGRSLREYWQESVTSLAVKANGAAAKAESTSLVRSSLYAQTQSVSGVSIDEESVNLLTFQRQFQAAAKFIDVIDETMETLLRMA
jgi:flagellar hook-associated protein 1 FlgK